MLVDGVPAYAWPADDAALWWPPPARRVRVVQRVLPHRPGRR